MTLGIGKEALAGLTPISEDLDLVEERTGSRPGSGWGSFFKLTPKVDDIPERCSIRGPDGVRRLVMGSPPRAGSGCLCPSYALVKELLRHLILYERDVVILDMEAGLEHFGRATARGVDLMLLITEPTKRSLEAIRKMALLARQLGVGEAWVVLNKVRREEEVKWAEEELGDEAPLRAKIPFDPSILEADREGISPLDLPDSPAVEAIRKLKEEVIAFWHRGRP